MSATGSAPRDGVALLASLAHRAGVPAGVHLQVADRCNHTCVHCYQVQGRKGEMTRGQIAAILDDLAAEGVMMLNVSGGEATLREDLLDILGDARARGFGVRLYTNAFALDDALADGIAAVGVLEVHVSVYSTLDAEHDAVTRVPGSLQRTLAGIRRLRARGVRVVMKTPVLAVASEGAGKVAALADSMGCRSSTSVGITPAEDGDAAPQCAAAEPAELVSRGFVSPWEPAADEPAERAERLGAHPCGVCVNSVAVMPNGEVRPCTDTIVPMGNLTRQRFREVYREQPVTRLIAGITWSAVHGCRDCDLVTACSRCHAAAAQEGGDYLGPYASACALARARYAAGAGVPLEVSPGPDGGDGSVGPYAIVSPGILQTVADVRSHEDDARASAHSWLRPDRAYYARHLGAGVDPVPLRGSRASLPTAVTRPSSDPILRGGQP